MNFQRWLTSSATPLRLCGRFVALILLFSVATFCILSADAAPKKHKRSTSSSAAARGKAGRHPANRRGGKTARLRRASKSTRGRHRHKPLSAKALAKSRKLTRAFFASSQLRPMAQQLAQFRTPAAYGGVAAFARSHPGEAASAAYLALGHAYLLDHNYPEAVTSFQQSAKTGQSLDDYADYLTAQADLQGNKLSDADMILSSFEKRHPDSVFVRSVPVLESNLLIQQGNPQGALAVLRAHGSESIAEHADFQLSQAKALQMSGQTEEAAKLFRHVFLGFPLSNEAQQAKSGLSAAAPLTAAERRAHADALYHAGKFGEAEEDYRALSAASEGAEKNAALVSAAACNYKLKRLNKSELDALPDTADEAGAQRLYLYMELARDKNDADTQRSLVDQMRARHPDSPWLAEALYSSGNMYLLRKDFPRAIEYYADLAKRFPKHTYAPSSHWRAAWLSYRSGQYSDAAKLFDEQIALYPGGREIPAALYWRGRIYEQQESRPETAAAYYETVVRVYQHFYYAAQGRARLTALKAGGHAQAENIAMLTAMQPETIPELTDDVPEDDPHVVKAKLLANAGLNEYIAPEIHAADGSDAWGAFAEAEIYVSYGENFHAMRLMKRAIPFYTSAPVDEIPMAYWRILFPQSWWGIIKSESARNNLDPYMVAALIRQETEFNPGAVSNKSAYGLMQLLPSVGKSMAKEEGIKRFETNMLLDPAINIRLGTRYLRMTLEKFGGQPEYAFAAYNAGDDRVYDWQSIGHYHGIDEFVESIPFTETREYVQAIVRNEEIYKELDAASNGGAKLAAE